jgi:hypothetical protein
MITKAKEKFQADFKDLEETAVYKQWPSVGQLILC